MTDDITISDLLVHVVCVRDSQTESAAFSD